MAIIAISRQVAALGDEIAAAAAEKLGYKFIDRKQIEQRIVTLGFPKAKLPRYDEKKPGFFASLVKERDEYLNYLQYAVLEAASQGNCILIGRGAFIILEELENLISLRFVASDEVRLNRLQKEFDWTEKQAQARINESDANRMGFHKSFFNLQNENPQNYHLTLNTGILNVDDSVKIIENLISTQITEEKEKAGIARVNRLLKAQEVVNTLVFESRININFLRATVNEEGTEITLHGVADSQALAETAVQIASRKFSDVKFLSNISIVQNFKSY